MVNFIRSIYYPFIALGKFIQPFLLLAIRLFWGLSFFLTGLGKIRNIQSVIDFFRTLDIPYPEVNAYIAAYVECIGGLFLLIGFMARFVSIPLIFTMVVALLTAHRDAVLTAIEDPQNLIAQSPFNYLLAALIVLAFGPGMISIDYLLKKYFYKNDPNMNS